jgi:hypothetical protein
MGLSREVAEEVETEGLKLCEVGGYMYTIYVIQSFL